MSRTVIQSIRYVLFSETCQVNLLSCQIIGLKVYQPLMLNLQCSEDMIVLFTITSNTDKNTVMDTKDWTLHRAIEVKVPWLRAVPARQEWILPLKKLVHFFLGPWLLVCQFIDISNQMETDGEVSNIKSIFFNRAFYNFFC